MNTNNSKLLSRTSLYNATWNPAVDTTQARKFINELMCYDAEKVKLLLTTLVKYIKGDCKDKTYMVLIGHGNNGKTVFDRALEALLGRFHTRAELDVPHTIVRAQTLGAHICSVSEGESADCTNMEYMANSDNTRYIVICNSMGPTDHSVVIPCNAVFVNYECPPTGEIITDGNGNEIGRRFTKNIKMVDYVTTPAFRNGLLALLVEADK